jgi:hypothetical protein
VFFDGTHRVGSLSVQVGSTGPPDATGRRPAGGGGGPSRPPITLFRRRHVGPAACSPLGHLHSGARCRRRSPSSAGCSLSPLQLLDARGPRGCRLAAESFAFARGGYHPHTPTDPHTPRDLLQARKCGPCPVMLAMCSTEWQVSMAVSQAFTPHSWIHWFTGLHDLDEVLEDASGNATCDPDAFSSPCPLCIR